MSSPTDSECHAECNGRCATHSEQHCQCGTTHSEQHSRFIVPRALPDSERHAQCEVGRPSLVVNSPPRRDGSPCGLACGALTPDPRGSSCVGPRGPCRRKFYDSPPDVITGPPKHDAQGTEVAAVPPRLTWFDATMHCAPHARRPLGDALRAYHGAVELSEQAEWELRSAGLDLILYGHTELLVDENGDVRHVPVGSWRPL